MKTNYLAISLLAIATLAGCAQQQPKSPDSKEAMAMAMPDLAKEEAAIRATDAQWRAAVKSHDAAKTASFWSDDATILFANQAPVIGKKAILEYVTEAYKDPDFMVTWTPGTIVMASSGDMAYQIATDTFTFRQGKKIVSLNNNGMVVWRKQSDGSWKAAADIGTPAAPENATAKK